MTQAELKEAEKFWRVSIHFMWWIFIVYGNWKRRVIKTGFGFEVMDWHPIKPIRGGDDVFWEEIEKLKIENPERFKNINK